MSKSSNNPNSLSLDDLFTQYKKTKDGRLLLAIAPRLTAGEKPSLFIMEHQEEYSKYIKTMQNMRIIGKEKGAIFTRGEIERTKTSLDKKGLTEKSQKTAGSAPGVILSQDQQKLSSGKAATSYMVKEGTTTENLVEVIGSRFYNKFAGQLGNVTAKTRLVSNQVMFNPKQEETFTGSRFLNNYQEYLKNSVPVIKDNKVLVGDKELKGYIATLVTAKFIQDFDAIGYGSNSGFLSEPIIKNDRTLYPSAKIDPGNSFGFIVDEGYVGDNGKVSLGVATNLKNKMHGAAINVLAKEGKPHFFHTNIPLDYVDPQDTQKLRPELGAMKDAIEHLYPNIDARDLLMGEMTYAEISKSPKLYKQMAKTVEAIANCSDTDLEHMVDYRIPVKINGEPTQDVRDQIFDQLKTRREVMKDLYAQEIEYMKLYRAAKEAGENIDFERLKAQAAKNAMQNSASRTHRSIAVNNDFKTDLKTQTDEVLLSALTCFTRSETEKNSQLNIHNYTPDIELAKKMMLKMVAQGQDVSRILEKLPRASFMERPMKVMLSDVLMNIPKEKRQDFLNIIPSNSVKGSILKLEAAKKLEASGEPKATQSHRRLRDALSQQAVELNNNSPQSTKSTVSVDSLSTITSTSNNSSSNSDDHHVNRQQLASFISKSNVSKGGMSNELHLPPLDLKAVESISNSNTMQLSTRPISARGVTLSPILDRKYMNSCNATAGVSLSPDASRGKNNLTKLKQLIP